MESYAVDKNRNFLSSSKVINTAKKVSDQYAAQMKDEIKARIANVSDDSVESEYTKLITHPSITTPMTKTMTALALKKFINENINGKQVELDIVLSSIDENRNPITNELEERLSELNAMGKLLEAQRLEQRTRFDIEMLREMGYCPGVENYSMHLSGRNWGDKPYSLLKYFPDERNGIEIWL